ncbi:AAA family ATPase [Francisella sp. SYW-9]|uniref:AAA family ATPase n=1 Tax=Francisella sp. SYW-9 TaxID=2610888 RepID=UPI00123E1010|nr:AAA family ATPase [Francisella sp. SYW-9]
MILLVGGQKGGAGKTTIATNIACYLKHLGKDVILVDSDKQNSTTSWIQYRLENEEKLLNIPSVKVADNISQAIKDLKTKYDYIIIDCAGRDSKEQRTGMLVSDYLLIPVRPSQYDLDTLENQAEIVESAKTINENLKSLVMFSMCPTHHLIDERDQAEKYLREFPEFTLLESYTSDRKVYRDTAYLGKGVIEINNSKAAKEIKKIVNEIYNFK